MLRKLFCVTMSALLLMTGPTSALADSYKIETTAPKEALELDSEFSRISVAYDESANLTRYTLTLKDGAPVSVDDVLFTLYVYLDPGYTGNVALRSMSIPGLRSYRLQLTDGQIADGQAMMRAIRDADFSYEPTEADGWTEENRALYRELSEELAAAQEQEFPVLAQQIVDYCISSFPEGFTGALDLTAEEILANNGLRVAYAMSRWGYATYRDGRLTTTRSRTVFELSGGIYPTLDDFTAELRLVHNDDFASCWAIECPNPKAYNPVMPDLETSFLSALYEGAQTPVAAVAGIRKVDESSIEIFLTGVDMRSDNALFAVPMLSLADCGDASLWDPENGLYGHPFGDVSAIDFTGGVLIYNSPSDSFYTMD